MTHQLIKECFFIALPRKCVETQRANKGVVSFLSLSLSLAYQLSPSAHCTFPVYVFLVGIIKLM